MDFSTPIEAFYEFIAANLREDPKILRLKTHGKVFGFDTDFAITQIECRKKGGHKLHDFISNPHTLFPSMVAYEQASHESVAKFHASLVTPGTSVIDMTAGLGIDSMAFAKRGCSVTSFETDRQKAEILRHNAKTLGLEKHLSVINADSTVYIKERVEKSDVIFVDPARRSESDSRLYNMHDCAPDVLTIQDHLLSQCDILLIKASPLLDISQTLRDIPSTKRIWAISVEGECKEVLTEVSPVSSLQALEAIDLRHDGSINYRFAYSPATDSPAINYASEADVEAGNYLYEPGPTVMKLTPWGQLQHRYPSLRKLGSSSHLFVSPQLIEDFPGRILRIQSIIDKKSRKALKGSPANVVVRNYPLSADELRKKLCVKEGKDEFIYASRLGDSPIIMKGIRI